MPNAESTDKTGEHNAVKPVLIAAEDDKLTFYISEALLSAGFEILPCRSPSELFAGLINRGPSLVVVDRRMKDSDGTPLHHAIRRRSLVPILVVADEQPEESPPEGQVDFLFLPLRRAELIWRANRLVRGDVGEAWKQFDEALKQQLLEFKLFSTFGQKVTSEHDLDKVLNSVVSTAVHLTNAEEGLILLLDDEGNELYLRASKGLDAGVARTFRVPSNDSLAWQAVRTMNPILASGQGWQKIKTAYLVKSLLYVPLAIKGRPLGVLGVNNRRAEREFTEHDRDLLTALGSYAAIAIENARLVSRLEQSLKELKETQAQLVQAARLTAMGELAAAVAHQINNPLTTVLGDAELALDALDPNHPAYESVQAIYRAGRRAHEVVSRLLMTARRKGESEPEDVNQTIRNALELTSAHIEHEGVELIIRLAEGLPPVNNVAHGKLEDVWLNLLLNARDAVIGIEGAKIGVESSVTDGWVQVVVWDNGHGMTPDVQNHIFDPFFTTKPPGEGTGLGLTICHKIVTASGGTIRAESTPGRGSRFIVRLPPAGRGNNGIYSGS